MYKNNYIFLLFLILTSGEANGDKNAKRRSSNRPKPLSMGMVHSDMSPGSMIPTGHLRSYAKLINLLRERTIGELWKTYFPRGAITPMKNIRFCK